MIEYNDAEKDAKLNNELEKIRANSEVSKKVAQLSGELRKSKKDFNKETLEIKREISKQLRDIRIATIVGVITLLIGIMTNSIFCVVASTSCIIINIRLFFKNRKTAMVANSWEVYEV